MHTVVPRFLHSSVLPFLLILQIKQKNLMFGVQHKKIINNVEKNSKTTINKHRAPKKLVSYLVVPTSE